MKRISLLILILLFLFSCTSFAAEQWQFVVSDTESEYFFDTQSIKYANSPETTIIDKSNILVSVKRVYSARRKDQLINALAETMHSKESRFRMVTMDYAVDEDLYNISHNCLKKYSVYYYDKNNEPVAHKQYPKTIPTNIAANSAEEKVFNTVAAYAKAHDEEIMTRSIEPEPL
jgi:hypothetical protein